MKNRTLLLLFFSLAYLLFLSCSKVKEENLQTRLLITLKDTAGASVSGATVRLYKNDADPGIIKTSDSSGLVFFPSLDVELYYWLAEKGCKTNRNSQMTLNKPLISGAILYGYSVLSETGTLKITNNAGEPYLVTDSVFTVTLASDTTYIMYPKIGTYLIHSEKVSTPGIGKDSVIQIACGTTTVLDLPY